MNKLFNVIGMLMLLVLGAFSLASCGDDDDVTAGADTDFTLTKSEIEFSCASSSVNISAKADNISASSDADWLKVVVKSYSSVTQATPITITADENTGFNDRSATVTIVRGSVKKYFKVTQTSTDGIVIGTKDYTVSDEGDTVTVQLQTNGSIKVTPNVEWIVEKAETRANLHDETHTFVIEKNIAAERKGMISFTLNDVTETVAITQEAAKVGDITASAADIAKCMYPGWNLGNTLEGCNSANNFTDKGGLAAETSWQSTKTSKAIIDAVRDAGFKSVRIPVAWVCGHISGGTELAPEIDANWMARVREIVDYCIADGLYVVLNDHWDGGWLEVLGFSTNSSSFSALTDAQVNNKITTLKYLWTQIANEFKDYDEHLLFAGLNEPFQEYSLFNARHQSLTPTLIKYNTAFVEAVRATGGNNVKRTLVVQGPSTNVDSSCKYMDTSKLPESAGHLMVEVHYYDPGQFCGTYDSNVYFWGSGNHSTVSTDNNATWGEESYMKSKFDALKSTYTSKGYPVIIGEYAAVWRSIVNDQDKHNASVKLFYKLVNQYGVNDGIIPFAWDTNYITSSAAGTSTIINRSNCTVFGTYALEGIKEGVAAAKWPY